MPNLLRYRPSSSRISRSFTPLIEVAFGRMSFHGKKYFDTGEIRAGRSVAGAARLGCFTAGSALDVGEVAVVGRRWESRSAVLFDRGRALDNVAIEKIQHLEPE